MDAPVLRIHEIFYSIQGESLFAGKPTVFIRLAACNLRCTWCDTGYAFWKGAARSIPEILEDVKAHPAQFVCVTGGEPLGQKGAVPLMKALIDEGYTVSLETNGSLPIDRVPGSVVTVMDLKCPDSGEEQANLWTNIPHLDHKDQVKFVVASREDFDWAGEVCRKYDLEARCGVLFSPVFGKVDPAELAQWVLTRGGAATLQLQLHKQLWDPKARGV